MEENAIRIDSLFCLDPGQVSVENMGGVQGTEKSQEDVSKRQRQPTEWSVGSGAGLGLCF